ncbi:MAG TPA: glycine cleavage system aminomethyltransferase GcvT [Anaerolineaceae bacterium]|nr:glycine cleavage system aminomethyltransferase GcvT [Anaerolineaceae bacterium]
MDDFLFRGKLADLDSQVYELTQLEAERQFRKLILIPSESQAPAAVREALGSVFQNIYAEGYPDEETRGMSEEEILDYPARLAYYRRYSDPRYYKGVEYADTVEELARRRCAEAFAANGYTVDQIQVNVQPLSGAPANNAVYTALLNPGDAILGMNLLHGGHLSHGSPINRSGKLYQAFHYTVDPMTEKIDYDAVQALATEHSPKIIIAGYSSYSWVPDWARFRAIADSVGATLMADVSHIAGLIAARIVPSPVGHAQVITFTTHKTLIGPRAACILTTDSTLGKKIDRAVFPGEQGGPHVHAMAALATTFKLAQTPQFKQLQEQIVRNCRVLNDRLKERGFHIPFNGTDTHLTNIDCKSIVGPDGTPLSGDLAARILDIAGLVCNRNTIPGDKAALQASGVRMGTPWMTQRGLKEEQMVQVADIIADILHATRPYTIETRKGPAIRAKVDFSVLEEARIKVRSLAEKAGADLQTSRHGYPHFNYLDDRPGDGASRVELDLTGEHVRSFLNYALTSDIETLQPGTSQLTLLKTPRGEVAGTLACVNAYHFKLTVPGAQAGLAATWLRDLSDGFVAFDADITRRIPGPVVVLAAPAAEAPVIDGDPVAERKPFFIGISTEEGQPLPAFVWQESDGSTLRKTSLNETHKKMGARMVPFAGWEMPVWYSSVVEEHLATRQAAGLFDVSHMGVYQAEGPDALSFLDSVCGNDIAALAVGESAYTQFLTPEADVIDDGLVYRRSPEKYLVVVNASNDDKDWAWLNAVREGKVCVDERRPWATAFGREVVLRNLRDPKEGPDMRVDIALQGPRSKDILLALGTDPKTRKKINALKRTELCDATLGGFDLVVSRTGYTGEKMAFELFIHPEKAPAFWDALLEAGKPMGLKPCGLGARDSLRTEAGLPLYGNEMGGEMNLGVAEAGFGSYVKTYKAWFVGREAYIQREKCRTGIVVRFRFTEKGVRMAHHGDPVLDKKGRVIGQVTSCAVDSDGFLTGQAFIEEKSAEEGTQIAIFQSAPTAAGKAPAELKVGDRLVLPTPAVVTSRFPK